MKKDNSNFVRPSRKPRPFPVKLTALLAVISLVVVVLAGYIFRFLTTAEFFRIKDIVIRQKNPVDLSYLKGRNIFTTDLKREAADILAACPDYNRIKLVRVLPNRVFVDFIKREPVVAIKLYKYFTLDQDGVLFSAPSQAVENLDIPVILGLETKIFGPKLGAKYQIKEIQLALNILKEMKRNKVMKNYRIKEIDVSDIANTSIFIAFSRSSLIIPKMRPVKNWDRLEVKIGRENIKARVNILASLFNQSKTDISNIKYIDLRFREPVIKLRDNVK